MTTTTNAEYFGVTMVCEGIRKQCRKAERHFLTLQCRPSLDVGHSPKSLEDIKIIALRKQSEVMRECQKSWLSFTVNQDNGDFITSLPCDERNFRVTL